MNCPRCAKPMRAEMLDGHLGREVEVWSLGLVGAILSSLFKRLK